MDINFAGESVPLQDLEIYERFDRELLVNTYWQSNCLLLLKRTHKYFPLIESILKKNGIPDDFKYLAIAESGLQNIVSPAGATGFWQLMKAAATENGLEVNKEIDERYNFIKSTEAACDYLNEAYKRFGSWTLAAASYNMGMNGLAKQLKRQEANSYYDLTLNRETARYVFRILALKQVLEDPTHFGFHYREKDLYNYPKTYQVRVDTAVENFASFARDHKISYRILKYFNPWLRQNYLKNTEGKVYWIEIPKEGYVVESFDMDTIEVDSMEAHYVSFVQENEEHIDSLSFRIGIESEDLLDWNSHLDSAGIVQEGEIIRVLESPSPQTTVSSEE